MIQQANKWICGFFALIMVGLLFFVTGCPKEGVVQKAPKRDATASEAEEAVEYAELAFASLIASVGVEENGHWDTGGDFPYLWLQGSEPDEIDPEWNPRLILKTEDGKFSFEIVSNGAWTAGLIGEMDAHITVNGVSYREYVEDNLRFSNTTISGHLKISGGIQQLVTKQDIVVTFKDLKFVDGTAVSGEVWYTGLDTDGTVRITSALVNQVWY